MKDSTDAKEKTSRRSFAKSVATALVAAPVVSSLSSCAQKPGTVPGTPSPHPYRDEANPPVIIDGGSFQVMIPATLDKRSDDNVPPKKYKNRFYQRKDSSLGAIKKIHIIDDYADDLLAEYHLGNQTMQVHIWIAKATEFGDYESDTDTATYDPPSTSPIPPERLPDIVIQGGKIEIRMDKDLDNDNKRKIFKRAGRNQRRYHIHDWEGGHSPFRIAKVVVMMSSSQTALYDSERDHTNVENGFRIILI